MYVNVEFIIPPLGEIFRYQPGGTKTTNPLCQVLSDIETSKTHSKLQCPNCISVFSL